MALTKNDIVERLQADLGLSKSKSIEVTECLFEQIKASLESGQEVLVSGFGKFRVKDKNQRRGRNPATGEDVILPPRRVVTFKCSGKLRRKVNGDRHVRLPRRGNDRHLTRRPALRDRLQA
ncbi:MAG: integration host factor subunit alpha [Desulfobacterales bacterium]